MRASNGTHAILPQRRLDEHARLASTHSRLIGATLTLLRSAQNYGLEDDRHMLAIAEVREALGIALDDLAPLLAASVEREDVKPADVVNTCHVSCGMVHTKTSWPLLQLVGIQADPDGDLELRNCSKCGSTRAVLVSP